MATPNPNGLIWDAQFAREVQDRIIPSTRPSIPNLDYYSDGRRARQVNGDYLDYFEVDEGNLCIAMGDVGGSGVQAALLATSLHSIVRALRFSPFRSVAQMLTAADELFRDVTPDGCHSTLFLARYDPVTRRLRYVNAGHEPPLVLRRRGKREQVIRLEPGGAVLGLLNRPAYRERTLTLEPGDLMVAHTDGVSDALDPLGEPFGSNRLVEAVIAGRGLRMRDTIDGVWRAIDRFTAGEPPTDDMTLWIGRVADAQSRPSTQSVECEEPVAA